MPIEYAIRRTVCMAGLLLGAMLLVACGGGSSLSPGSTPTQPPGQPPVVAWSCADWCFPLFQNTPDGVTAPTTVVDFADARSGLAVSTEGDVMRSDDGGATWQLLIAKASPRFTGLRMLDKQVSYAWTPLTQAPAPIAARGLYRSADGGRSWSYVTTADSGGSNMLSDQLPLVIDANTVVIYRGELRSSLITRDGGRSWQALPFVAGEVLAGRLLLGRKYGSTPYSGIEAALWISEDLGITSRSLPLPEALKPPQPDGSNAAPTVSAHIRYGLMDNDPAFVWAGAYVEGWTDGARAFHSTSAGATWTESRAAPTGPALLHLNPVAIHKDGRGWAGYFNLYRTTDFGATWAPFTPPAELIGSATRWFSGMADMGALWFELGDGRRYGSADEGASWLAQPPTWEVGSQHAVTRTGNQTLTIAHRAVSPDNGKTWNRLPGASSVPVTIDDVAFVDNLKGYARLADGAILETRDGGGQWTRRALVSTAPATCAGGVDTPMSFGPDGNGWLGWRGLLWHSRDAGGTWSIQDTGATADECLVNAQRIDSSTIWTHTVPACPAGGTLAAERQRLRLSRDAGATWSTTLAPIPAGPVASGGFCRRMTVAWANDRVGIAGYDQGPTLYATSDGGASWSAVSLENQVRQAVRGTWLGTVSLSSWKLQQVGYFDAQRAWALVSVLSGHPSDFLRFANQFVLRSDDGGRSWRVEGAAPGELPGAVTRIAFADPVRGWAIAASKLYRTIDGGRNWAAVFKSSHDVFTTLTVLDAQRVWVGGTGGALVGTTQASK